MSATARRAARERLARGDREGPSSSTLAREEAQARGSAPQSRRRQGPAADEEDSNLSRTTSTRSNIGERGLLRKGSGEAEDKKESFIKVVTRIRPKIRKEANEGEGVEVEPDGRPGHLTLSNGHAAKTFAVDEVVDARGENNSQLAFFDRVARPTVVQALQGYNVCMFAYGHTGSGKTYTMLGDGSAHRGKDDTHTGILPRFLREIFNSHAQGPSAGSMRYSCEFYEVYNEQIRDLLAPMHADRKRTIHVHPKLGVKIDGISASTVGTFGEALDLVNFGMQMRTVAATTMNERSSRSHAIFTFKFEQASDSGGSNRSDGARERGGSLGGGAAAEATITFVDLAGREDQEVSGNQAMQYREMCYINTSLFYLAHLITKLSEGNFHRGHGSLADFRNSKLTLLLSQALVGNSRSLMIATLAPLKTFFDDSVSTMGFAQSVKRIQTKPVKNNKNSKTIVADLENEVAALREQLSKEKSVNTEKEQDLLAAQHWAEKYKQSWEEAVASSQEVAGRRKRFATEHGLADVLEDCPRSDDEVVPFFTKLCDDPALQGCCNYFLHNSSTLVGSDSDTCGIVVLGVGILPQMCEVQYERESGVEIKVVRGDDGDAAIPRVLVNGRLLSNDNLSQRIDHGDCVILGHSHAFRLVMAGPEDVDMCGTSDPSVLARSTATTLDMATALAECVSATEDMSDESGLPFCKEVLPYVQHLSLRSSEDVVQSLFKSLHCMCPVVDEANVITKEVWPQGGFIFKLQVITDCFDYENDVPEFAICVVQNLTAKAKFRGAINSVVNLKSASEKDLQDGDASVGTQSWRDQGKSPTSRRSPRKDTVALVGAQKHPMVHSMGLSDHMTIGKNKLLYLWSLEKFLRRLKEMREIYQEGSEVKDGFSSMRERLTQKPYLNPWREMNFADVKTLAEDFTRSGKPQAIVSAAAKALSAGSPTSGTSPVATPRFSGDSGATPRFSGDSGAAPRFAGDAGAGAGASGPAAPEPEQSPVAEEPKFRPEPMMGLNLRFPAAQTPPPAEFEEEMWKSLASLGSARTAEMAARFREAPGQGGVLVELQGAASAVEELRKTPLSKMSVLGAPVGEIQFKSETVPRLALGEALGLTEGSPVLSGTGSSNGTAGLKPKSLAEAVRAYVADGSSSEVRGAPAEGSRAASIRSIQCDGGATSEMTPAGIVPAIPGSVCRSAAAGVLWREDASGALPPSLGASPPAGGGGGGGSGPTPKRAAPWGVDPTAAMVSQMRELISDLKTAAASSPHLSGREIRPERQNDADECAELSQGDLDELRDELSMCKAETGRMFSEQGRLAQLLERFETLLFHLTSQDAQAGAAMPSTVTAVGSSRTHTTAPAAAPAPAALPAPQPVPVSGLARAAVLASPAQRPLPNRTSGAASPLRTPSPQRMTSPRTIRHVGAAPPIAQQARSVVLSMPDGVASSPSLPASASVPLMAGLQPGGSIASQIGSALSRGSSAVVAAAASPALASAASATASPAPAGLGPRRQFSPARLSSAWDTVVLAQSSAAGASPSLAKAHRGSLFSQIDRNNDGVITRAEFDEAIRAGMILQAPSNAMSSDAAASFSVPSTTPGITPQVTPRAAPWPRVIATRTGSPSPTVDEPPKVEAIRLTTPSLALVGRNAVSPAMEGGVRKLVAASTEAGGGQGQPLIVVETVAQNPAEVLASPPMPAAATVRHSLGAR